MEGSEDRKDEDEIKNILQIIDSEDKRVRELQMIRLFNKLHKTLDRIEGHLAPARLFYPRPNDPGVDMSITHNEYQLRFGFIVNTLTIMPTPVNVTVFFEEEWWEKRGRQQWRQHQTLEAGEGTTIRNIEVTRMFITNTSTLPNSRLRVYGTGNRYERDVYDR